MVQILALLYSRSSLSDVLPPAAESRGIEHARGRARHCPSRSGIAAYLSQCRFQHIGIVLNITVQSYYNNNGSVSVGLASTARGITYHDTNDHLWNLQAPTKDYSPRSAPPAPSDSLLPGRRPPLPRPRPRTQG